MSSTTVSITFDNLGLDDKTADKNYKGSVYDTNYRVLYSGPLDSICFDISDATTIMVNVKGMRNSAQAKLRRRVSPGRNYVIKMTDLTDYTPVYEIVDA